MMKTDLNKIKDKSKMLFDLVSFEDAANVINDEFKGVFISHPYTNTAFVKGKNKPIVNLLEDIDEQKEYRKRIFSLIDKAKDFFNIMHLLNKPYYLYWFKLIEGYLSEKDYANLLKEVWITSENPNMDINVPIEMSLGFFLDCNTNYLMDDEEKKFYNFLPITITLYRGVSKGRNPFGLSYTTNYDKAEWFSKRFTNTEDYIISLEVKKEDCICYINSRNEEEIVLNINNYLAEITSQIPKGERT